MTHFWPQNKLILVSLAVFLKKNPSDLYTPFYDCIMPELQSDEFLNFKQKN